MREKSRRAKKSAKKERRRAKKKIPGLFLDDNKVDIGGDEEEKAGEHFMQQDP